MSQKSFGKYLKFACPRNRTWKYYLKNCKDPEHRNMIILQVSSFRWTPSLWWCSLWRSPNFDKYWGTLSNILMMLWDRYFDWPLQSAWSWGNKSWVLLCKCLRAHGRLTISSQTGWRVSIVCFLSKCSPQSH